MVLTGTFRLTLQQLIDHALARCKIPRQKITGEHQVIAREALAMALAQLSNKLTPLWCQESLILPLYQQRKVVQLPIGTVDLLPENVFYRYMTRVGDSYASDAGGNAALADDGDFTTSLAQTSINGSITATFSSPTTVNQVGFLANGDQWHNFVFESSNDNVSFVPIQTIAPQPGEFQTLYRDSEWTWYEVATPPAGGSTFFRVRETGGGTINVRELYLGTAPIDIPMARLNRQMYDTLPNKSFPGRPLQFWLSRDLNADDNFAEQPNMFLWPVPGSESVFASVYLKRHRYIADIQSFNAVIELPVRWYNAICWWLADLAASEIPEVPPDRETYLQGRANDALGEAMDEERDNSPVMIQADISVYTR